MYIPMYIVISNSIGYRMVLEELKVRVGFFGGGLLGVALKT